MKLAHLADPHLGIRQYHRQTPSGINQREADVANAFRAAVDDVIACRPDAVVVAGDLFHAVRPTNAAIVFAFRQFQRLREALPEAPVVLIAGNHDTPRSSETGSILRLFEEVGVHVADFEARRLEFPALDLSIFAVPHQALVGDERPALRPDGAARRQVLVVHGEAEGVVPRGHETMEYGGVVLSPQEIGAAGWSYVAWGHYHVQRPVGARAWYAGSLEYVSTNIWGEVAEERQLEVPGKGWLLVDLDAGEVERRPVALARRILDLPPVAARDLDAAGLDRAITERVAAAPGGIAGQVVRLLARDVPRHVAREIDHAQVRAWKAEALHFQLDLRRPESGRETGVGSPGRRATLRELVADYLGRRALPAEVDREAFVALGVRLLDEADAVEAEG